MSTPQKNSRLTATPKHPTSPLVRTPKHSKQRTNITPIKKGQQSSKQSDRSQDLYKRICQGLLDNTRTPPKNKVLTPTKFFKNRAAVPKHVNAVKNVFLYFCDEPVEYIKDLERVNKKSRARSKRSQTAAVEMVMPFYNIKTVNGAQEHIEIAADIVEEIFEKSSLVKDKRRRSLRNSVPVKSPKPNIDILSSSKSYKRVENARESSDNKPQIYSFVDEADDLIEDVETSSKKVVKMKVQKPIADSSRKRKGTPQGSQPSKKSKTFVYNNPDSSDEDDDIFISTVKPILSEEEKREMKEILGSSDETEKLLGDEDEDYVVEGNKKQIDVDVSVQKRLNLKRFSR